MRVWLLVFGGTIAGMPACAEPHRVLPPPQPSCPEVATSLVPPTAGAAVTTSAEVPAPRTTPGGVELPAADWQVLKLDTLAIHFPKQLSDEAERLREYAESSRSSLAKHFTGRDTDQLMKDPVVCDLYLVDTVIKVAGPGRSHSRTSSGVAGKPALCEIITMPTSRYPADQRCCTRVGAPFDAESDRRSFVHEYAGVVLGRMNKSNAGWDFYRGPAWFRQGFEEYLAVRYGSELSRTVTLPAYRSVVAQDPARVGFFSVANDYTDGAVLLDFMHSEFGDEKVAAVLVSKEEDFGKAVEKELGVSPRQFLDRWQKWAAKLKVTPLPGKPTGE